MSLSKFIGDTNNIQSLPDQPSISASELKARFDKTGDELKTYINGTLTEEVDTELNSKANSNNVYTKTETDAKVEGTILAQRHFLPDDNSYTFTLNDSIQGYKCIEILVGYNSFKITKNANSNILNFSLPYIEGTKRNIPGTEIALGVLVNQISIKIEGNELTVRTGTDFSRSYLIYSNELDGQTKIKDNEISIDIDLIIGYK